MEAFIKEMPKVELHLHIEGTLEPELMMALAKRNGVSLPFATVEEVREAYCFEDLQSFLDIYYKGASVLIEEQDFYDLMWAYLETAAVKEGIVHSEIFFDPQTHTERNISFATFMNGFHRAQKDAEAKYGITSKLILCFLRHLSGEAAVATLKEAEPFVGMISGVGLDSSEVGNPPEKHKEAFAAAKAMSLRLVAHAGEEGDTSYITGALDILHVERIDHGVRCEDDAKLVARLAEAKIPLTMCPLSNLKLQVFSDMKDHNIGRLLEAGVAVTVNSDDPAYFGGYLVDNYLAIQGALGLSRKQLGQLARNGVDATFLTDAEKQQMHEKLDSYLDGNVDE